MQEHDKFDPEQTFYIRFAELFAEEIDEGFIPAVPIEDELGNPTDKSSKDYLIIYRRGAFKLLQDFLKSEQFPNLWSFYILTFHEKKAFFDTAKPKLSAWVKKSYYKDDWGLPQNFAGWNLDQITNLLYQVMKLTVQKTQKDIMTKSDQLKNSSP